MRPKFDFGETIVSSKETRENANLHLLQHCCDIGCFDCYGVECKQLLQRPNEAPDCWSNWMTRIEIWRPGDWSNRGHEQGNRSSRTTLTLSSVWPTKMKSTKMRSKCQLFHSTYNIISLTCLNRLRCTMRMSGDDQRARRLTTSCLRLHEGQCHASSGPSCSAWVYNCGRKKKKKFNF